jgi:hemolysin-activating ACP:hemolysin acyltransferase
MKDLQKHFITKSARNASEALAMAMFLWVDSDIGKLYGVQELVETINSSAIKLRNICDRHAFNIEEARRKGIDT